MFYNCFLGGPIGFPCILCLSFFSVEGQIHKLSFKVEIKTQLLTVNSLFELTELLIRITHFSEKSQLVHNTGNKEAEIFLLTSMYI